MQNIWRRIKLCQGIQHCHAKTSICGFTIVEVLVSIMITMTFLTVTLQMFLTATYLRSKTVEYDTMYDWMQEDFERVLSKAKSYEREALPFSLQCKKNTLASSFITDQIDGLGGSRANLGNRVFEGKTYELIRVASTNNTAPNRLLNVQYKLILPDQSDTFLNLDTRVSIIAAFNCPRH